MSSPLDSAHLTCQRSTEVGLTSPVQGDDGGNGGDSSQDGHDGQDHGVASKTASSVHVPLLQTVPGLVDRRQAAVSPAAPLCFDLFGLLP